MSVAGSTYDWSFAIDTAWSYQFQTVCSATRSAHRRACSSGFKKCGACAALPTAAGGSGTAQRQRLQWRREGRQEGISLGQLRDKQDVLIRTMIEPTRLDTALDEILFAETKDAVLRKLGAHE